MHFEQKIFGSNNNCNDFHDCLTSNKRVLIIGAGISGIGAARTLINGGLRPIILEARNRIGGRLCQKVLTQNLVAEKSIDDDNTDGECPEVVIQIGANWVHGLTNSNPMYKLAQKLNLNLHETSPDDYPGDDTLLFDGLEPITEDVYHRVLERYEWITDHVDSHVENGCDIALSDAFMLAFADSEEKFGKCCEVDRRCLNWCYDRVCIDSGMSIDKVSMRYYDGTASDGEQGEGLVKGGFFQLFQHLFDEVSSSLEIKFDHVVQSIVTNEDSGEVTVTCTNGQIFIADSCIVTIPLGVLQTDAVQFIPRPPQLDRMCKMQFGLMNLVWLWYPKQFWPAGYNFFGVARDELTEPTFTTFLVPPMCDQFGVNQNIVMCQTFGEFAKKIETMSEAEIAHLATTELKKIFGQDIPDACGCVHSSWSSESFSLGSYSCAPPVDLTGTATDEWCEDSGVQGLYFAGEATHQMHQGTAHGSYISGIREATKILLSFGIDRKSVV